MLLDPFTVIAQIVNFAILALALKHFLYDRVIAAMDERERAIAARFEEAERREAEASAELGEYERRNARLDRSRHELLDEARHEAEEQRQRLLDEARDDVEAERRRWRHGLLAEQDELHAELQRRTAHEVVELSREALDRLATVDLDAFVLDVALDRFTVDLAARDALLGDGGEAATITVRTAFGVQAELREKVRDRIRSLDGEAGRPVRFERDPALILGVELRNDGTAVAWNAADYLDRLRASVDEVVSVIDPGGDDR